MKRAWKANSDRHDTGNRPDHFTYRGLRHICVKANAGGFTKQAVKKRAKQEGWHYTTAQGAGGLEHRFALGDLPQDVQTAIRAYYGELPGEDISAQIEELARATQKQRDRVAAWQAVIIKWRKWYAVTKDLAGKKELRGAFVELVKLARELEVMIIPGLPWRTCRDIGRISVRTLERQVERLEKRGVCGLIRRQGGHNRGKTSIPEEQGKFILRIMCKAPQCGARRIATMLKALFGESAAGVDTVRRFISLNVTELPSQSRSNNMAEEKTNKRPRIHVRIGDQEVRKHVLAALEEEKQEHERFLERNGTSKATLEEVAKYLKQKSVSAEEARAKFEAVFDRVSRGEGSMDEMLREVFGLKEAGILDPGSSPG